MRSIRGTIARLLVIVMIVTLFIPQTVFADDTQKLVGSYTISDARTGNTTTISGDDGVAKMLIFGSYSGCPNTRNTVNIMSEIMESEISPDDLIVAYFAVMGDSDNGNDIASMTSSLSNNIYIANMNNASGFPTYAGQPDSPFNSLINSCWRYAKLQGTYTMPLVIYIDQNGNMVNYTTGGKTEIAIKTNLADLGFGYELPVSFASTVDVTGSREYALAYEVLRQLNEYRVQNGLNQLSMDSDLLEAAMIRSAEIAILFEHDRPDGSECNSVCPIKLMGENIACYQETPTTVMNAWKNSPGHNRNMLDSSWNSVGIGVFCINGIYYWSQEFSSYNAAVDTTYTNTVSIEGSTSVKFSTSMVGVSLIYNKFPYDFKVNNYINANIIYVGGYVAKSIPGYTLDTSDPSVLEVDPDTGKITAVGSGVASVILRQGDTIVHSMEMTVIGNALTPTPTPRPTSTPRPTPTTVPVITSAPTSKPVATPTNVPASKPTTAPTSKPTAVPTTSVPGTTTVNPTSAPVNTPATTAKPTSAPTTTSAPTSAPSTTTKPTAVPTSTPGQDTGVNNKPTAVPTNKPGNSGTTESGVGAFAERLYTTCLGRDSEPAGKEYWTNELKMGKAGSEVAELFFFSPEFVNSKFSNTEFITRLYLTFMGREPDNDGVNYWLGQLASGKDRRFVFDGFVNSDEWATICLGFGIKSGGTGTPTVVKDPSQPIIDFAERLYTTCLGREAEEAGLNYWSFELANLRQTGTEAAMGFFFSNEFVGLKLNNKEYITRLYRTFMGREPEAGGTEYWMEQLGNGTTRKDVFYGFATAPEFAELCADAGIMR